MKNGLILEGGGLRGLFTAGILDAWMQHDIHFDGIIGVSAGALFGCNFKSHQIGRALRYNVKLKDDPRYMSLRSFITTGNYIGSDFAYHVVPTEIDPFDDATFCADPTEFYVVATDIATGEPVYKLLDHIDYYGLEWMRATGSMPIVSTPVPLDGHKYLDGGISDSIPLQFFQNKGYEHNVVILTRPRGYLKKPTNIGWLFRLTCKKYPKIADAMIRRHEMYNKEIEYILEQEKRGNTLLIFPDKDLQIGRTELKEDKMRSTHSMGLAQGDATVKMIKEFITSN